MYRILSFLISDFFCLRWSNGTHRNPEIVAWIVAWRAHACDDLFQGLCTSCLCCSCSPLPWWIWCPGSTSGTVWKRWSMFAALNTSEYWQTEMEKWIKDEGTPQHTPTIELLSSFYFQMFTMTWCIWFTHVSKSHQSSAHKGRQDLLSVSYQPLSKLRMSLRLPGFHNIHAMIRWMLIWLIYAHDTHIYTYIYNT